MPVRFRLSESLLLLFLTGPKLYHQTNKKFGKCYMNSPEIWQSFVYNPSSTFFLCLSEVFNFFLFHVYLRDVDCKSILVKGQTHFVQVCKFILYRSIVYIWPLKKCHSITIVLICTLVVPCYSLKCFVQRYHGIWLQYCHHLKVLLCIFNLSVFHPSLNSSFMSVICFWF